MDATKGQLNTSVYHWDQRQRSQLREIADDSMRFMQWIIIYVICQAVLAVVEGHG